MEPDEEVVSDVHVFLTEQDRIHKVPDRHFRIYPGNYYNYITLQDIHLVLDSFLTISNTMVLKQYHCFTGWIG